MSLTRPVKAFLRPARVAIRGRTRAASELARISATRALGARIAAPVLAVHGTADRAAPFAQAQALVGRVPGAELLAIEGGEHVALFTHLAEVRARIGAFLRAHAPNVR